MNRLKNIQAQKGFTIIEVVLVLAIAGLIFLMVFIALPALQSNQRDTARKSDVGVISSAVTSYTSNNRGSLPTTEQLTGSGTGVPSSDGKFAGYAAAISNNTTSITVEAYTAAKSVQQGDIIVVKAAKCSDTGTAAESNGVKTASQKLLQGTSRQFAIVTYLEAGPGVSYCQDS